jgi:hypothetical protein
MFSHVSAALAATLASANAVAADAQPPAPAVRVVPPNAADPKPASETSAGEAHIAIFGLAHNVRRRADTQSPGNVAAAGKGAPRSLPVVPPANR